MESTGLTALFAIAVFVFYIYKQLHSQSRPPYPPGPPADPFIGHVRFIPANQHEWYHSLRAKYGNIFYLSFLGKPVIVVNNNKIATELLEKRGLNYSDRPRAVMYYEILRLTLLAMCNYTKRTIKQRSLISGLTTRTVSKTYQPTQLRECHLLMGNLLSDPKNFAAHNLRFTTAIVIETAYGHRITGHGDPYFERANKLSVAIGPNSGTPGGTPPDIIPLLKYLPVWFPGAWWSRYGKQESPNIRGIIDWPFEEVLRQMAEGTAVPSFVQYHMEMLQGAGDVSKEDAEDVKEAAAMFYGAGADTTWSTIQIFVFAMLCHPEAQKRAQRELDSVLGPQILPSFNDRGSLPFLENLFQEILRYYPTAPLGVPHRSRKADIFEGMYIPAGSIVIANTFGINRDPEVYADAESFKPERYFLEPEGNGEPYPPASFGYGRRVCPGRWLAEGSIWIAMAHILALFDITPVIGQDGHEILPDPEFVGSFNFAPKPFVCEILPRSNKSVRAITDLVTAQSL